MDHSLSRHQPVLLKEVIHYLAPQPSGHYLDGTVGGGGHTLAILEASAPTGRVLGLDRDPTAIARLCEELGTTQPNLTLMHASYSEAPELLAKIGWEGADGALLDLGLSSMQLDDEQRGMSFRKTGPLDLRFDQSIGSPASAQLATWTEKELTTILEEYGELYRGRELARQIKNFGSIVTTDDLKRASGLSHPRRLSQLFQAIRIATNDELSAVQNGLAAVWSVLRPGARLVTISFHSLEDRLVKQFYAKQVLHGAGQLLMKKVVIASDQEQRVNPRSRSAKLRAIEKK